MIPRKSARSWFDTYCDEAREVISNDSFCDDISTLSNHLHQFSRVQIHSKVLELRDSDSFVGRQFGLAFFGLVPFAKLLAKQRLLKSWTAGVVHGLGIGPDDLAFLSDKQTKLNLLMLYAELNSEDSPAATALDWAADGVTAYGMYSTAVALDLKQKVCDEVSILLDREDSMDAALNHAGEEVTDEVLDAALHIVGLGGIISAVRGCVSITEEMDKVLEKAEERAVEIHCQLLVPVAIAKVC